MPTAKVHSLLATSTTLAFVVCTMPSLAQASPPTSDGVTGEASSPKLSAAHQSEFDALLAEASQQFDDGDFESAVDSFEKAYEIQADASLLYNIGRVYEEMGQLEPAIEYYARFARQPGIKLELREQAVERVKVLKDIVQATTEEEEQAPAPAPLPEPKPEPEPAQTDTTPGEDGRGLRIAGYALLGVGGAVLIGGGVAGGLAGRDANDLEDETQPGQRRDLKDSGETKALAADIMFIAGGTLALTGVALVVAGVVKKRRVNPNVAVAPVASPTFGGATMRVFF